MSDHKFRSSQAVGAENAKKLKDWIKLTPLHKVPLNSRGESAKSNVCRLLQIPPSTIGTNAVIKELFDKLDTKLSKYTTMSVASEPVKDASDSAYDETAMLRVLEELERLRASNARLRHLDVTGQFIPEK